MSNFVPSYDQAIYYYNDKWHIYLIHPIHARSIGHSGAVYCVAFTPDGTKIVSGGVDKNVRIWNFQKGRQILTYITPLNIMKAFNREGFLFYLLI